MTIRPPTAHDWERIGDLAEVLVRTHYAFDRARFVHPDTLRSDAYTERLREEIASGRAMVQVAEEDGCIAGYVFAGIEPGNWKELRHDAGYIHDLVVDEAHRKSGIGQALVTSAIEWLRGRGLAHVMLWTAPSNLGAQRLFRRAGFRETMIEMTLEIDAGATRP
jgi:ribosomal protein S18 acetylase RimI-like enzyme